MRPALENPSMRTSALRNSSVLVKDQNPRKRPRSIATRLIPVQVRRTNHSGLYFLPTCGICSEPIRDFESANVVVRGWRHSRNLEPLGKVGNTEFFRHPGEAIVVHFECDRREFKPWIRASSVFSRDQRHPFEKLNDQVKR